MVICRRHAFCGLLFSVLGLGFAVAYHSSVAKACTAPVPTTPEIEIEIEPEFEDYDPVSNRVLYKIEVEVQVASPSQTTQCQCGLGVGSTTVILPASFSVLAVAVGNRFNDADLNYDLDEFAGFTQNGAVSTTLSSLPGFHAGATAFGFATTVMPFDPPEDTPEQKLVMSYLVAFAPEDFDKVSGNLIQFAAGSADPGHSLGILNNYQTVLTLPPFQLTPCDVDFNGECDLDDLNAILAIGPINAGVPRTDLTQGFDLNGDDVIDNHDVDEWLAGAAADHGLPKPYQRGDADLNGQVNLADLLVWLDNYRERTLKWDEGDFNGDGVVNFADFKLLRSNLKLTVTTSAGSHRRQ